MRLRGERVARETGSAVTTRSGRSYEPNFRASELARQVHLEACKQGEVLRVVHNPTYSLGELLRV
jgi:hypothetical protein